VGPDAGGAAKDGLCRAWDAHRRNGNVDDHSVAMQQLAAAARVAGVTIEQYCADVLGSATSVPTTTILVVAPTTVAAPSKPDVGAMSAVTIDDTTEKDKGKGASGNGDKKDKSDKNDTRKGTPLGPT
jgi:hypothetical protein